MEKHLEEKLFNAFPNLYIDKDLDRTKTLMCYGFSCGNGWFDLIWNLSEKLENIILSLPENERYKYRAVQVKEKFGSLRFYLRKYTEEMLVLVDEAELESETTCMFCSKQGSIVNLNNWLVAICEDCFSKKK